MSLNGRSSTANNVKSVGVRQILEITPSIYAQRLNALVLALLNSCMHSFFLLGFVMFTYFKGAQFQSSIELGHTTSSLLL